MGKGDLTLMQFHFFYGVSPSVILEGETSCPAALPCSQMDLLILEVFSNLWFYDSNVSLRSLIPESQECESGVRNKTKPWASLGLWLAGNQAQAGLIWVFLFLICRRKDQESLSCALVCLFLDKALLKCLYILYLICLCISSVLTLASLVCNRLLKFLYCCNGLLE